MCVYIYTETHTHTYHGKDDYSYEMGAFGKKAIGLSVKEAMRAPWSIHWTDTLCVDRNLLSILRFLLFSWMLLFVASFGDLLSLMTIFSFLSILLKKRSLCLN